MDKKVENPLKKSSPKAKKVEQTEKNPSKIGQKTMDKEVKITQKILVENI